MEALLGQEHAPSVGLLKQQVFHCELEYGQLVVFN